ncbi:transposase [Streptomyces mirabilis]|uniref:transposase n=1 Tax=Streptomyces mirabilis TaxID=68239 RepID=UPI003679C8ED
MPAVLRPRWRITRPCASARSLINWGERFSQRGQSVLRVVFSVSDCRPCPLREACINTPNVKRPRELRLRRRDEHAALQRARAEQQTDAWKERYKVWAGVEGTMSQAVQRCGLRRSRYGGLAKTSLQYQLTGAAINFARIDAHITQRPRARTSHFTALRPAELILNRAK